MGVVGEKLDIDFVISTGDNFYDDGLTGTDDPAFNESFSRIYTADSLQKQWYSGKFPSRRKADSICCPKKKESLSLSFLVPFAMAVLGNHDYRGDVLAQLSPVLRKLDTRWLCLRSFILNAGKNENFLKNKNAFSLVVNKPYFY